jgi:hypothetical protein
MIPHCLGSRLTDGGKVVKALSQKVAGSKPDVN